MKLKIDKHTIKWQIIKYNLIIIFTLALLTYIIFNVSIHFYIDKEITTQLDTIAYNAENALLMNPAPNFTEKTIPPKNDSNIKPPFLNENSNSNVYEYYFVIDRSLKQTLTLLNADFILLDKNKNIINPINQNSEYKKLSQKIVKDNERSIRLNETIHSYIKLSGTEYSIVIQPISDGETF